MDIEGAFKAAATVLTPLVAILGIGGRRRRLRGEIRENLALMHELQSEALLRDHTPALGWLGGKVALDIARLAGQPLGQRKKPLPKGSIVMAAVLGLVFGALTGFIVRDGFVWYAIFPGTISALCLISIFGMFMGREIPDDPATPAGATPVRLGSDPERIAAGVQLAASGADLELHAPGGRAEVALKFIELLGKGEYESALQYADPDWLLCRIQSRLWLSARELNRDAIAALARDLYERREHHESWQQFVAAEAAQFIGSWGDIDTDKLGIATRRRRLAEDYDLVIMTPLAGEDGFFVTESTLLPQAITMLLHKVGERWLVANHVGIAPPTPGVPPSWWAQSDYPFDAHEAAHPPAGAG